MVWVLFFLIASIDLAQGHRRDQEKGAEFLLLGYPLSLMPDLFLQGMMTKQKRQAVPCLGRQALLQRINPKLQGQDC